MPFVVEDPKINPAGISVHAGKYKKSLTPDLNPEPVSSSPDSFHKVHMEVPDSGQWLYSIICDSKCISNIGAFINRL